MSEQIKLLSKKDALAAVSKLRAAYPNVKYYLNFSTPLQLLVAAILSTQTHDTVVNDLTPELFLHYKAAKDFAAATESKLMPFIRKASFAGNKAKNIIKACNEIVTKFNGKVPNNMQDLVSLPGIGRKTANTILINAYGIVEGIPVDTWVIKLSNRIGLSQSTKPDDIEQDLMQLLDKKYWHDMAYIMKAHGHAICKSSKPLCKECMINNICLKNCVQKQA